MVPGRSALIQILVALTLASASPGHCSRPNPATAISLLQQHFSTNAHQQLHVALAAVVPYGVLANSQWRDGLAVMAYSAQKAARKSEHRTTLLALLPDTIDRKEEEREVLAKIGMKAVFVPIPVPLKEVKTDFAREELKKVLGVFEQLKYYGAGLTEYDRVVILDGDTMWLSPIDELFNYDGTAKLQGIYDHELDVPDSAFPPLNTGFLVFTPDKRDFDTINDVVREGDFRPGTGWEGSKTGWTYGTGSQGVLSFYYNQVQPGVKGHSEALPQKGKDLPGMPFTQQPPTSRFRPLDRSVYNVIDTKPLNRSLSAHDADASRVKLFHFTGGCVKPWQCSGTSTKICEEMTERWWAFRAELAAKWGGSAERCEAYGEYKVLPLPEKPESESV
uniref:Hexosyltransferase n=1 Tax=Alexandrium catenella TaxID=2925 RepID=A0A7S1W540_ALECA